MCSNHGLCNKADVTPTPQHLVGGLHDWKPATHTNREIAKCPSGSRLSGKKGEP